jgi:hypothetical protein
MRAGAFLMEVAVPRIGRILSYKRDPRRYKHAESGLASHSHQPVHHPSGRSPNLGYRPPFCVKKLYYHI